MEEQIHAPTIGELPTKGQLNKATAIAAGVAAVLLATVVLPAEYGVDPTGIGGVLGLTEMGTMKRAAATDAGAEAEESGDLTLDPEPALTVSAQSGVLSLTLQPGEGREIKATMAAGGELSYDWSTSGPIVHYELHGEPKGGAKGEYSSFDTGKSAGEKGDFRAPFEGTHGWYWRNDNKQLVTVTVRATGSWAKFELVPTG